ncbi:hypothetical protein OSB04_013353 [Centaurea solstitialis]|uniref:Uncharacterized protein n=1 Tax=Centaurea solstitialis TaxID=347529 RepID=A0AA38WQK2_9ASTR|nr:hypothetical protein OSB04_013353 [Centaurea solstitialis]
MLVKLNLGGNQIYSLPDCTRTPSRLECTLNHLSTYSCESLENSHFIQKCEHTLDITYQGILPQLIEVEGVFKTQGITEIGIRRVGGGHENACGESVVCQKAIDLVVTITTAKEWRLVRWNPAEFEGIGMVNSID